MVFKPIQVLKKDQQENCCNLSHLYVRYKHLVSETHSGSGGSPVVKDWSVLFSLLYPLHYWNTIY